MAREYRTGDCVLAMTTGPDLVLSLTCNLAQRWQVTVFDSAQKKAAVTDHDRWSDLLNQGEPIEASEREMGLVTLRLDECCDAA